MALMDRIQESWRRFYDWKTEHQFLGRYSVDKLQLFDRYQTEASVTRCLVVICLLSVLPALTLLVGLHAIPLNSPELGVRHNAAATVRSALAFALVTVMWVFYMMQSLGAVKNCRTFVVSVIIGGVIPEGFWMLVSMLWRYPVPGSGIAKMLLTLGCIIYLTRYCHSKETHRTNRQRTRILTIVTIEYLVVVVFFLLLALAFSRAPWGVQLALMVAQPPLRSLLKRHSWVYARKLSDLSTDVTLNIVDMSASMYQALCIQYTHNAQLAAAMVIMEFMLGIAVARMYATHTFIVDGYRTLLTAIKIVEGSLSSTLVTEEDESRQAEVLKLEESPPADEATNITIPTIEGSNSRRRLRRVSSDTITTNSRRSSSQYSALTSSRKDQPATKCFPIVIPKMRRVVSDPVTGNINVRLSKPSRRHSIESNGGNSQVSPYNVQRLRRVASCDTTNGSAHVRPQRRMTVTLGRNTEPRKPPLTPKSIQLLRRTASDTMPESKSTRNRPTRNSTLQSASAGNEVSQREPRLQSWSRDPSKVYCFTDIRPEIATAPPSPKQKLTSLSRRSSVDLPPLGNLQPPDGFGRRLRSTSVFLTPRTLMKSGSKRLLDLGRSGSRSPGYAYAGSGETSRLQTGITEVRKPTQINIDGMLVVRKDQARILEQTLQLLFSCEVLVVTEFVRVLMPLMLGLLFAALWSLPSARYNVLVRNVSREEIMERMLWCLCFAVSELPALAMICITVYKKYGISPLHLLAFLLEQQYANFQTKLTSCLIALTLSTSVHQGMDWASWGT